MDNMGDRIRRRRKQLGLNQTELALRMGYKGKGSIARIESGETELNATRISQMAVALETTEQYLMGWEDEKGNDLISKDREMALQIIQNLTDAQAKAVFNFLQQFLGQQ